MSPTWVKALILACTFGAVLLAVETLLSSAARSRAVGHAINLRMRLIGSGRSRGETFNLLRRSPDELAASVPPFLAPLVVAFERLLTGARVRVPTGRMILLLLAAGCSRGSWSSSRRDRCSWPEACRRLRRREPRQR